MLKFLSQKTLVKLAALLVSGIALTGFGCRQATPATDSVSEELIVWGLWQESADMEAATKDFTAQTGIKVLYKKIASVATYERDLVQALAEGRGPDVFVIHHTWINDKLGIMSPAPEDVVDLKAVQEEFVDVAAADLVRDGQVWALPTSVDSLALFFNRDLLNAAGVARAPSTWTDYQQMVEKITRVNRVGVIQQSAGAIGTAANINRAGDILQALFLQSGLPIVNERGEIDIDNDIGERALTFYTDFANKEKLVFTWDLAQDFSIDAFAEGEAATMINYSYHIPTVRAKNPRLNFGVAPLPQIAGSAVADHSNFTAYWPFAVSNSSSSPRAAWNFVRFLTSAQAAPLVNAAQNAPPARRDGVQLLQRDPDIGVFANQSLTAKTWPRFDIAASDAIFNQLIDSVITGASTIPDGLARAQDQLNQLQSKKE